MFSNYYADEIIAKSKMYDFEQQAIHDAMVDEAKNSGHKYNLFGWGQRLLTRERKEVARPGSTAVRHWDEE